MRSRAPGFEARLGLSGGAADANVFNARGLRCVNLANGMTDIHTRDERIAIDDLERMVDVTLALVDAAREEHSVLLPESGLMFLAREERRQGRPGASIPAGIGAPAS